MIIINLKASLIKTSKKYSIIIKVIIYNYRWKYLV